MWTRNERIGAASLAVALFSCLLAALTVREVRLMLGLRVDAAEIASPGVGPAPESESPEIEVAPVTPPTRAFAPTPTPTRTGRALPVQSARASSELPPSRVARYAADMVLDGMGATPWVENAAGYGIGEWIELRFGSTRQVTHLRILNGYDKDARYAQNGRARSLTATFSTGRSHTFSLADHAGEQIIALEPVATSFVRLTINSAYPGSRWEDTALGDVAIIGY